MIGYIFELKWLIILLYSHPQSLWCRYHVMFNYFDWMYNKDSLMKIFIKICNVNGANLFRKFKPRIEELLEHENIYWVRNKSGIYLEELKTYIAVRNSEGWRSRSEIQFEGSVLFKPKEHSQPYTTLSEGNKERCRFIALMHENGSPRTLFLRPLQSSFSSFNYVFLQR